MPSRLPNASERLKRGRLTSLLGQGKVLIQVDTRHEDVDVPDEVGGLPLVSFRLSHRFHLDVFEVGPLAVIASLSFDQGTHRCVFPWNSIFGMTAEATGETEVFEESAPPEYLALVQSLQAAQGELSKLSTEPEAASDGSQDTDSTRDNEPPQDLDGDDLAATGSLSTEQEHAPEPKADHTASPPTNRVHLTLVEP